MPSLIFAGTYSMFVTNLPATAQVRPAEIYTRHFAYGKPFRSHVLPTSLCYERIRDTSSRGRIGQ